MIDNLNIMLPEIFLSLSIFTILMIGVFIKNSFNIVFNLSSLIIIFTVAIILNNSNNEVKIFLDSFTRDAFSNYFKILILISSFFVLNSSKNFIVKRKWKLPLNYKLEANPDKDNKNQIYSSILGSCYDTY